ncbi:MAG: hypothetical protein EOP84_30210 [Verrucomicrobiaceae bacterium]|nr:MAG: hypothetical protein EOP84_30210 [Verrucomicrobiaceae bacterium]
MKSLSSAIVVLAGIYAIVSAGPALMVTNSASFFLFPLIGLSAGIITLALGLVGWWASLKYDR